MLWNVQANAMTVLIDLLAPLVLSCAPLGVLLTEPADGGVMPNKGRIIGWEVRVGDGRHRRFLLPADSCYGRYASLADDGRRVTFRSIQEAEAAGYSRAPYAIPRLRKYVDVCSHLYEYFIHSTCERNTVASKERAEAEGLLPIERFDDPRFVGPVVAITESKLYRTACDPDYECLLDAVRGHKAAPRCRQVVPSGDKLRVFETEGLARQAGYISIHEALHSEVE